MDGHALMRKTRELGGRRGSVRAFALTGYTSLAAHAQALLARYQVFLPKPFDPAELITSQRISLDSLGALLSRSDE